MNPNTSADALTQLQQFQASARNPGDILTEQQNQLGVPAAQQNISGLRGAIAGTTKVLNNIAPGVMGRTGDSLVTSAQANRQIQGEQAPVAAQLTSQNGALDTATQDYNIANQRAETAANLAYQGQQSKQSYLQNIYDALFQKEQAAQAQALEQQKLQEQIREANLSAATARATAGSGFSPSFNGSTNASLPTPAPQASDPIKAQAQQSIFAMFGRNDQNSIKQEIAAIQKSAGYGNTFDQLKLQLIKQLHPEYLASSAPPLPGLGQPASLQQTLAAKTGAGINSPSSMLNAVIGR